MSHTLTIQLSDAAFSCLKRRAAAERSSPADVAAASLERLCTADRPAVSNDERQAARERFERHFGAVDLGYPTGADNVSIDAELAAEYEGDSRPSQR